MTEWMKCLYKILPQLVGFSFLGNSPCTCYCKIKGGVCLAGWHEVCFSIWQYNRVNLQLYALDKHFRDVCVCFCLFVVYRSLVAASQQCFGLNCIMCSIFEMGAWLLTLVSCFMAGSNNNINNNYNLFIDTCLPSFLPYLLTTLPEKPLTCHCSNTLKLNKQIHKHTKIYPNNWIVEIVNYCNCCGKNALWC